MLVQSHLAEAYQPEDGTLLELLAAHIATALKTSAIFSEVERLATTDGLTGLCNRRQFFVLAQRATKQGQSEGRPVSAILLDLDYFKQINDQHGHQTGDEVLRTVAHTCRSCLRDHDLIGRYGGEEFAILLPGATHHGALKVGERIKCSIAELVIHSQDQVIPITASLGVATNEADAQSNLDHLLARADRALYHAKDQGRNRVISEFVVSLPTTIRD
ncbi:MAG: GGDEF domain-containing protein [Oscillochloridaceae bacterium umkhey_bin13]